MRKAMIVMLAVLVLALGGSCFAAVKIYDSHDEVTLTETTIWGDKEYIEDLSMQIDSVYVDRLRWSTVVPMENLDEAVTDYEFSMHPVYADIDIYTGLNMDSTLAFLFEKTGEENQEGIGAAYQELADITGSNEEMVKEIYLKDYIDYYSYNIQLDLPGTDIYTRAGYTMKKVAPDQENYVIWKINDFFKIPVLEEERCTISLGKNEYGDIDHAGSGSSDSDSFYMWTHNAIAEDACYFTFDSHSQEGVVMDTSLIPGGYGIYCLPYESGLEENADRISVDVDGLRMVYSLDPEIDVMYLHLNSKKDKLLLHAEEYGKYVLTVIEVATMETLQKITIMDFDKEYGYQLYDEGDFIVTTVHKVQEEGQIEAVVMEENENGEYEVAFICDIQNKEIPNFNTSILHLAFDGKRLAMSGFLEDEERNYRETCNVFLAVCDESGMKYYGEYRNSLETGYGVDSYYYHCQGYGWEPILLEWMD